MKRIFCLPVFLLVALVAATAAPAPLAQRLTRGRPCRARRTGSTSWFSVGWKLWACNRLACARIPCLSAGFTSTSSAPCPPRRRSRDFLADQDPAKRAKLIDRVLQRDEFADYWAMKWSDLLRVKAEFPINLWPNAVQAYHRWIRTSIFDNVPYDRFVQECSPPAAAISASGRSISTGQCRATIRRRSPRRWR
jgi:hypothetical protein